MKKLYPLKKLSPVCIMLALMLFFSSCRKPDNTKTFEDVFDVSGIENLNVEIDKAKSPDDLTKLVEDVDLNVSEEISAERIEQLIKTIEQNLELSDSETDKLLRNDPEALLQVLERFGNIPVELSDKNMDFRQLQNSPLSRFTLVEREEPGSDYYPEDYYSAIKEYRRFIEKCVIWPLKKIHVILLQDESQLPPGAKLEYYVLIAMNNKWDMWWSYWRWGCFMFKIKHKGGHGSFPG